jgi:tetratricopeptide (TPR) repeat protein
MKRTLPLFLTALILLAGSMSLHAQKPDEEEAEKPKLPEGVHARITMKDRSKKEVVFKGRGGTAWIRMVDVDPELQDINMRFAPNEFAKVEFVITLDAVKLAEALAQRDHKTVLEILKPKLEPLLEYIDLPNNVMELVQAYQQSMFWNEDWDELLTLTEILIDKVHEADLVVYEAMSLRAYALLQKGKLKEAKQLILLVENTTNKDTADAAYWFTMGAVHLESKEMNPAQDAIAKVIGFHTKDQQWMPAGLYMSAKGYIETHNYKSAEKVLRNIGLAYPSSKWKYKAVKLLPYMKKHEEDWIKAETERKAREAKIAAELALPYREQVKLKLARDKLKNKNEN